MGDVMHVPEPKKLPSKGSIDANLYSRERKQRHMTEIDYIRVVYIASVHTSWWGRPGGEARRFIIELTYLWRRTSPLGRLHG